MFRLLLAFTADRTRKKPCDLDIGDLDAPLVGAFLNRLGTDRGNGVRTRNHRLAAIHSLFGYAALRHPEHVASIQRVLANPPKPFERNWSPISPTRRSTLWSPRATGRPGPDLDRAP